MTFILAIQLEDSIAIAADTRSAVPHQDNGSYLYQDGIQKLFPWENGIITGTGELNLIQNVMHSFNKFTKDNIHELPNLLKTSKLIREQEITHSQLEITKLLYSTYSESGAQLYSIQPKNLEEYEVIRCEENEILLWTFNPDIRPIINALTDLYSKLKPLNVFNNTTDCIYYYLNQISPIFHKQAQHDSMMSKEFNFFFQTKDEYFFGEYFNNYSSTQSNKINKL
ncbi:hypothetical protein ODQ17_15865 [Acinetobacter sp. IRS14]|uniref:hypothetical protein n=1 Tax=Acinetobacter sp. IRS14 TaxID=2983398 RepID=UPI002AFE8943|nr:hypothetical protein [Acinetobacter sp. IRS14]MEA1230852.1 hypothetical protein [Acinetobacter sp. IRS14]